MYDLCLYVCYLCYLCLALGQWLHAMHLGTSPGKPQPWILEYSCNDPSPLTPIVIINPTFHTDGSESLFLFSLLS